MASDTHKPPSLAAHKGTLFALVAFLLFFQAGLFSSHSFHSQNATGDKDSNVSLRSSSARKSHPIPELMTQAEISYRKKMARQSKSLHAAVAEYVRRYHRNPPKGFDLWWEFAQANNVKLVDEYDGLVEDLAPFWNMTGQELRRRAGQVTKLPAMDVVRIRKGKSEALNVLDEPVSGRAQGFRQMLEKFEHTLPDMDFAINGRAEGRVLVPWEHRQYPNTTVQDSSRGLEYVIGGRFTPGWDGEGSVWDAWRRTCHPSSAARRLFSGMRSSFLTPQAPLTPDLAPESDGNGDFIFARDTSAHLDFCDKPHARFMQGLFFSDFRTIPAVYPVFSPAKARGFLDIRIPSHYYYGSTPRYTYGWDSINIESRTIDPMEVPWHEKKDKIFWRGASIGGGNHPPGFSDHYQRHRLVRMASDQSKTLRTIHFADPPTSASQFASVNVPIARLNSEMMDIAFVNTAGAPVFPGGLKAMQQVHRFADAASLGEHWSYKYVLDLDGNSYSARFMAFLASDSAVVKSTVYQEYFSDWIQPWVHFIPVSSGYREIYNIYSYFSGPIATASGTGNSTSQGRPGSPEGDKRLRRIARAGKQWKNTIGRHVDMEAYVYRLCLEYARLWADDRASMDFTL